MANFRTNAIWKYELTYHNIHHILSYSTSAILPAQQASNHSTSYALLLYLHSQRLQMLSRQRNFYSATLAPSKYVLTFAAIWN